VGDTLLVLLNGHHEPMTFSVPEEGAGDRWVLLIDTNHSAVPDEGLRGGARYELDGRSLALFRLAHPVGDDREELATPAAEAPPVPPAPEPEPEPTPR
jgi:hypothetical protein